MKVLRDLMRELLRELSSLLTPRPLAPTPASASATRPVGPAGPADRRRLAIVALTLAAGALVLGAILATPRGSTTFTILGLVLAAIWLGGTALVGGTRLGLQRLDRGRTLGAIVLGVLAWLGFLAASLVAERITVLDNAVGSILDQADTGPLAVVLAIALLNAVAEEVFFRGVLLDALGPRYGPVVATVIYVAVTAASLNLALVLAALVMGVLWMVERLSTGTPLASVLTHVTWSTLMLLAFPG
jgi:membrane protease YdiL (CAAX protease family)